ncbi:MAG: cell envelope integrity protein TolA [bacterium]|nr:cell envelope integrity protein TolA [bacterium]
MPVDSPTKDTGSSVVDDIANQFSLDDPFEGGGEGSGGDQQDPGDGKDLKDRYDDAKDLKEKYDKHFGDKKGEGETEGPAESGGGEGTAKPGTGEGESVEPVTGNATGEAGNMGEKGLTNAESGAVEKGAGQAGEKAVEKGGLQAGEKAAANTTGKAALQAGEKAAVAGGEKLAANAALEAGGDALAVETAGISKAVQWAIQAAMLVNDFLKKYHLDFISNSKNLTKLAAMLIIVLTVMGAAFLSSIAFGAIEGSGGKSQQVAVESGASDTNAILTATKQTAKSNVTLSGLGIPGLSDAVGDLANGGSEKTGELRNNFGFSIAKYKRLELSKRDKEFLNSVYSKGYDPKNNSRMDRRVLDALIYLANRHSYIKVSNIVYLYEKMPVDFENSSNSQVVANISAHVSGQAADIRAIDFIYDGIDPLPTCGSEDPRRDIVWFNDRGAELLRQRCKGSMAMMKKGGPIFVGRISTEAIPIQIAWQDESSKKSGGMAGTLRGSAESFIERLGKLPVGSLDRSNGNNPLAQFGFSEIAQQLGVDPALVKGSNPTDFFTNLGKAGFIKDAGLGISSLNGSTLSQIIDSAGSGSFEEAIGLPAGSWKGKDLLSTLGSLGGLSTIKEFGFSEDAYNDPNALKSYFAQELFNSQNIEKIAKATNFPADALTRFIDSAKSGTIDEGAAIILGARRFERSLGIDDGVLDPYITRAKGEKVEIDFGDWLRGDIDPNSLGIGDLGDKIDFAAVKINMDEEELSIPEEKIKAILNKLGDGEDISDAMKDLGGWKIDNAFALVPGTTKSFEEKGDGDPFDQIDLLDDSLLQEAGTALFKGRFDGFIKDYGTQLLSGGLTNGPRNMTVSIDEAQQAKLKTDPISAAEEIGGKILARNLGLAASEINKFKGGQIQNLEVVNQALQKAKWSDDQINIFSNTNFTSMPSVREAVIQAYGIRQDDYSKFISGDFIHMDLVQEEAANRTGLSYDDIAAIVDKDYKHVAVIGNYLLKDLKWSSEKINSTPNSEIAQNPQVKTKLGNILKISGIDTAKLASGDILGTSLFSGIVKDKLDSTPSDAIKLQAGQAKDVTALKKNILGKNFSKDDIAALKEGDIKAMPFVRSTIMSKYNLSDTDMENLYSGKVQNISLVKSGLAKQWNISEDDAAGLMSGDFKDLQFARDLMAKTLKVPGSDIDIMLEGKIGHMSTVQNELSKTLNLPVDDISMLIDSKFKDANVLKNIAMDKLGITQKDINSIVSGDILLNSSAVQDLKKKLAGKITSEEINSVIKGDWLGANIIKGDLAGKLGIEIPDVDIIKLGNMENLPLVQDMAANMFNVDNLDLGNLTSGNWGSVSVFQGGLASSLNLGNKDVMSLVSGNLPNLSSVGDIFSSQFKMDNFDLQNLTGKLDLGNIDMIGNFADGMNMLPGVGGDVLGGLGAPADMLGLGNILGGGGLIPVGGGEAEIMQKVKRPEARYKVHKAIGELLDITTKLNNHNLLIRQLITFSKKRDVDPFKSKLDELYGKAISDGGTRAENYGLFQMKEAQPNIHIGY